MSTEVQPQTQTENAETQTDLNGLSFPEFERVRRGERVEAQETSAPVDKTTEQKPAAKSDNAEEQLDDQEEESSESDADEAEGEEENSEKDKPKRKSGFQRRVDKLNAKLSAKDAEIEHWRAQALKRENASDQKPLKAETPKDVSGKPKADDFDTHAEYVEAVADWKAEQKFKERDERTAKAKLIEDQEKLLQTYSERVKTFSEKRQDFQGVMESVDDILVSPTVQDLILNSENGPELAYELAKDKEAFERINKLSPIAAAREVGKLEARLASKAESKTTETKKITQAPKPLTPVSANGKGGVAKTIFDKDLSFADYERIRRAEMRQKSAEG